MLLALEEVRKARPKAVKTATLIHKKQSRMKPDFYGKQTNSWEWIILPWNVNEDLLNLSRKIMKEDGIKSVAGIQKKLSDRFGLEIDKDSLGRVLKRRDRIWL